MDFINEAQSAKVRASILQATAQKSLSYMPSIEALSMPPDKDYTWVFPIGERYVQVTAPERGGDGPYFVVIGGDQFVLLSGGIDSHASNHGFHRISEPHQYVTLTSEWKGAPPEQDAMQLLYLINTLSQIIPSIDWVDELNNPKQ